MHPNQVVRVLANYRRSKMIANEQRDQSKVAELSSLAVAKGFNDTGPLPAQTLPLRKWKISGNEN
ncbi:MAG: hypothetical protein A2026_21470 [Deltaproteobacteria bacterium RBG_19FT_COMBO_46_12]|nr:MAG: hypothetical protein A2026_21470 [Deltaproteobacteria bacterium RBG_19FT_COMBO_46_12]